ncbi:hypothetical protein HOE52_03930 [Candidatus Woesearchaeota archaeon]|jgi:hypothetical protein|nr:hypothetical protein [Candidatus Woesearchaeota archaeon]
MVRQSIKKRISQRKKNLPVHSNGTIAKAGEVQQHLVIFIIAAVVILGLVAFLFLVDIEQLAGQAYFIPGETQAGIIQPSEKIIQNQPFTLTVKAGTKTKRVVGVYFEMNLPKGITCETDYDKTESLLGWTSGLVDKDTSCKDGIISFKYSTIDADLKNLRSGDFDVAKITFKGFRTIADYDFTFKSFDIYDLGGVEVINKGEPVTISVVKSVPLKIQGETCAVDKDCTSPLVCDVRKKCNPVILSSDELSIIVSNLTKVFKVNTDKAAKGETLTINVKASPKLKDLPKDHLVIVQVQYGTSPAKSLFFEQKANLGKGKSETVQFTHQVDPAATGKLIVKAFVWGNWPKDGKGTSLVKAKDVTYEIQ